MSSDSAAAVAISNNTTIRINNSSFLLAALSDTTTAALCSSSMQQQQPPAAPPPPVPPPEHDDPSGGDRKSERKRQRERQRRSALAGAFDELAALISQIEPEYASPSPGAGSAHDPAMDSSSTSSKQRKRRRSASGAGHDLGDLGEDSAGMTRLDLIGRTTGVLRRLQQENADLRRRLMEGGGGSGDDDQKVRNSVTVDTIYSISAIKLRIHSSYRRLKSRCSFSLLNLYLRLTFLRRFWLWFPLCHLQTATLMEVYHHQNYCDAHLVVEVAQ